ncbi:MAG: hypothetical protein PHP69_02465 [Candidatus Omnitrophica bacterium]|nr:hypothetical protein [Candidatus Omnitrophota bacterium]MDD5080848.1 hypothetical protein [Candidatus Omnitrophota bacterium]
MSVKIRINLNPNKKEKTEAVIDKITEYTPYLGVAAAVFLVFVLLLQVWVFFAAAGGVGINMEWNKWEDRYIELEKMKSDMISLEKEKGELLSKKTEAGNASELLAGIFRALPESAWLISLNVDENEVLLRGNIVAVDKNALGLISEVFIQKLKEEIMFEKKYSNIKIKKTKNIKNKGVDVIEFEILCTI